MTGEQGGRARGREMLSQEGKGGSERLQPGTLPRRQLRPPGDLGQPGTRREEATDCGGGKPESI